MATLDSSILNLVGNVSDATQMSQSDGAVPPFTSGRQGDQLVTEIHGKHYVANYRGKLFEANVSGVVLPVAAATLVLVFALYNPSNSGINMELVDVTVSNSVALTVVQQVGWYFSTAVLSSKATFTTAGTVNSGMVGASPPNKGQFYSALTHSGTPALIDVVGAWTAATAVAPLVKFYDGRLILPPGVAMSIAGAGAVQTGVNCEARWMEYPV